MRRARTRGDRRASRGVTACVRSRRCPGWPRVAGFFLLPDYLPLGAQILLHPVRAVGSIWCSAMPASSRLGHAAFFGLGAYTAGILAANGWGEPITGLAAAAALAAAARLRRRARSSCARSGLTLLMLTLVVAVDPATRSPTRRPGSPAAPTGCRAWRCGRSSACSASTCSAAPPISIAWPCCSSAGWSVRRIVYSPFGRSLTGIRENAARMHAIGAPVFSPAPDRLHDLGGAGRRRRRADRADHPVRRAQRARPRALRRRADHADHRRRRPALRRLRRRAAVT